MTDTTAQSLALAPPLKRKNSISRRFEPLVLVLLAAASAAAVLTTIGIVLSVVYESLRFFSEVPLLSFLFGTEWAPTAEPGRFGILPLLAGTLLITLIAVVVAGPLGLFGDGVGDGFCQVVRCGH